MKDPWVTFKTRIDCEDTYCYVTLIVNGQDIPSVIHVKDIAEADRLCRTIKTTMEHIYNAGYNNGIKHLQQEIKGLIGLK